MSLPSDITDWPLKNILSLSWDTSKLTEANLRRLSLLLNKVHLESGSYLTSGDCAYIVLRGKINFVLATNPTDVLGTRTVGQPVGFTSLLSGMPVVPRAICETQTSLLRFPLVAFDYLTEDCHDFLNVIIKKRIEFSFDRLQELKFEYRFIKVFTNTTIVNEGDPVTGIFVILTGEMIEWQVMSPEAPHYRGPGELIGVRALISSKTHTSSFKAIRNSEVVKFQISKEQLAKLISNRPKVIFRMSQQNGF